jgi:A/G-specific adenine glycosylase
MLEKGQKAEFQRAMLDWFHACKRDLPWRRTEDPYAIWISEVMLQQTRVAAVIPFYERFLQRFPDFHALAAAPESDLLACWAGLGYYYRARNLQKAARAMCALGSFPSTYEDLQKLPGVGDYTSAAIASIAFRLPYPAIDGNVLRVLSRVFADPMDIASPAGRRHFKGLAGTTLMREQPGTFNQAMMELGATICLPKNPQCLICPISHFCKARQTGQQNAYPVKLGRGGIQVEKRTLFWIERNGKILAWQRSPETRLMPGFWELPERAQIPAVVPEVKVCEFRHSITFHRYRFEVCEARVPDQAGECQWLELQAIALLPVSTVLRKAHELVKRNHRAASAVG